MNLDKLIETHDITRKLLFDMRHHVITALSSTSKNILNNIKLSTKCSGFWRKILEYKLKIIIPLEINCHRQYINIILKRYDIRDGIIFGDIDLVKIMILLKRKTKYIKPNVLNGKETTRFLINQPEILKLLLNEEVYLYDPSSHADYLLCKAAYRGKWNIVWLLVNDGRINFHNCKLLTYWMAVDGQHELLEYALKAGCINVKSHRMTCSNCGIWGDRLRPNDAYHVVKCFECGSMLNRTLCIKCCINICKHK
jgi:hypothetical protein